MRYGVLEEHFFINTSDSNCTEVFSYLTVILIYLWGDNINAL